MSFPLLDDVERLEADAARIRVQTSVLKIKETAYKCDDDDYIQKCQYDYPHSCIKGALPS